MKLPFSLHKRFIFLSLSMLFVITLFLQTSFPAFAQATTPNSDPYLTPNTDSNVPANLHTYTQSVVIEALDAVSCFVTGVDFLNPQNGQCLGFSMQTGKIGYVPTNTGGALPIMGKMISMLYVQPYHTTDFIAYVNSNFITNKNKSYAATNPPGTGGVGGVANSGLGFQGLTPLIGVWAAFRNIVYLIFVVFFILIGLGIMLRVRIDPKTTLNIQNALPKIIIALLLVTFSFAIAGLLVDGMYLVSYIVVTIMHTADPTGIDTQHVLANLNKTPMGFTDEMYRTQDSGFGIFNVVNAANYAAFQVIDNTVTELVSNNGFLAVIIGIWNFGCWGSHIFNLNPDPQNIPWAQCAGEMVGYVAFIFIWLILYFAILSALFRLWFEMIKAYVLILIDTCLAPFYIGLGVIAATDTGFGAWIRGMLANLMIFPASIFMFLLAKVFMDKLVVLNAGANGNIFIPPLLGNLLSADPQFNQNNGGVSFIGSLVGFGIILLTPTILSQLREKLKTQPNKYYGTALGTALAAGTAGAGIVSSRTWGTLTREGNSRTGVREGILRTAVLGPENTRWRATSRRILGTLGISDRINKTKNKT